MSRRLNKGYRDFRRWKSCERKRAFATEEAAQQKGMQVYQCQYCGRWHRSGALNRFINRLRR